MNPYKAILPHTVENEVERTRFHHSYDKEDIIDIDYVHSVGGMEFILNIRRLFLNSSAEVLEKMSKDLQKGNHENFRRSLSKLMGTANAAGALKLVRCIMTLLVHVDQGKKDLSRDLAILIVHFRRFNQFLLSDQLKQLLAEPRS